MSRRRTEQREAIRTALAGADRPLSVEELLERARSEVPSMGLATVYRNLKVLLEDGEASPVELPGQPPRYERAGLKHHHHFQCDGCGRVFDVPGCRGAVERSLPEGFEAQRHEVTVFGTCAECA